MSATALTGRAWLWPTRRRIALIIGVLLLLWLLVLPLVVLAYGSLRTSPFPPAAWTVDGFVRVLSRAYIWRVLGVTLGYSAIVALLGTAIAIGMLLIAQRSAAPFRRLITPSMVLLLVVPKAFYALAWAMAGSGTGGLINRGFDLVGAGGLAGSFSMQNWFGVIAVSVVKTASIAYLLLLGPFRAADPATLEAARVSGAGRIRAFLGVELPSLTPAVLSAMLFGVVLTLQEFEVPAILGLGKSIRVFSTSILLYLRDPLGPDYTAASAASLLLVAIVALLVITQIKMMGKRSFVTVSARATQRRPAPSGRGRYLLGAVVLAWIAVTLILPVAQMVVGSLQSYFGVFSAWTTSHYSSVMNDAQTRGAIVTTVVGSIIGALAAVAISFALGYAFTRRRGRMATAARFSSWIPATMPGLVLGLALLWIYTMLPGFKSLYGTAFPLTIGLIVAVIPFAVRSLEGALVQVSPALEQAARVCGDSFLGGIRRVMVPLVAPAVIAAWLLSTVVMSGTLDVPLLLSTSNVNTVSTLTYEQYLNGSLAQAAALYCATLVAFAVVIAAVGALVVVALRATKRARAAHFSGSPTSRLALGRS